MTYLAFGVVPGKLLRSTQSAARPELSQICNLGFFFVLPARWYWANPLGSYAILTVICERGLALLITFVKDFRCMDKS